MKAHSAGKRLPILGLTLLLGLIASGCSGQGGGPASGQDQPLGTLTFRAGVASLGLASNSLTDGKSIDDFVEVELPGLLYDSLLEVKPITKENADRSTPVATATSDYSAIRADDTDWILENFIEEDHLGIMGILSDEMQRDVYRKVFAGLENMQVWGEARLEGATLLLLRYNNETRGGAVLTLVETPDGWKRTNRLELNETFDVVVAALRSGTGITPQ